ncbi:MAG: hypothetical protein LUC24_06810 [Bacteroidales bacterium]|nr:hypothetical protein [Bacteroidales bacterium]
MAKPFEATPILYGEDARRFKRMMQNPPKETPEERERRLRNFEDCMRMLEAGRKVKMKTREK